MAHQGCNVWWGDGSTNLKKQSWIKHIIHVYYRSTIKLNIGRLKTMLKQLQTHSHSVSVVFTVNLLLQRKGCVCCKSCVASGQWIDSCCVLTGYSGADLEMFQWKTNWVMPELVEWSDRGSLRLISRLKVCIWEFKVNKLRFYLCQVSTTGLNVGCLPLGSNGHWLCSVHRLLWSLTECIDYQSASGLSCTLRSVLISKCWHANMIKTKMMNIEHHTWPWACSHVDISI